MTTSRRLAALPLIFLGLTAIAALVLIPWVVQAQSQTSDENTVVWSADMFVVEYTSVSIGAASADLFSNIGGSGNLKIKSLWSHVPSRDIHLSFEDGVPDAADYTLKVGDLTLEFPKGSSENSSFKWADVDVDWEDGQTIPVSIVPTSGLVKPTTNSDATGLPTISGTPQVRETLTADTADIADGDGLNNVAYLYQWIAGEADINGATSSTYTLTTSEQGKTIKVKVSFTDDADNEETLTSEATVEVAAAPNRDATGAPTISGTPQVRETLATDTADIADGDGLSNVTYRYQWITNDGNADADIEDATDSTYKLSDTDVGKTIKVRVSFADDADNDESLTSVATTAVLATVPTQPLSLAVATGDQIQELDASWQAPSSNGGSAITGYKVQWKEAADSWDTAADVSEATVTGTTDTITGLTGGVAYAVRVIASNVMGYGPASTEAAGTPSGGISEQNTESENSAPAGLPTISGTPEAEQTLTADTSAITDGDGLTNVSYGYQWIRNDGNDDADIEDSTDSTYKLSDADVGKTIKVKVSFTDDADNQETLTSAATDEVVAAQASSQGPTLPTVIGPAVVDQTLTVSTSDIADDDGLTNVSYSYQWIRSGTNGDTDIAGQTASTYTLVAADVGNAIKVKVSFDDDANNQETRTSEATATVVAKPNVIVILVDDLGYNDVSYNGATQIQTTNIDRLASRGVTFTNGYVPYSTCTPSRAGLLTGRYPSRFGLEGNLAYAPFDDNHGLPLEETLFPERLQDEGYRTGIVGKWQLGAARRFNPLKRGFDYFFGFLGGGHSYWHSNTTSPHDHMRLPLIENTGYGEFDGYLTDVLTDRAIDFIEKPTDEPFFLYLAYNAPHTPLQAPQELIDKYSTVEDRERRIYLAMVDSLDQNIGRMLDALDESSLADNTVIFFLSDNGGRSGKPPDGDHADNSPLRGAKDSFYEGGIHVPFVASWPAMWPEGHTYDPMVISLDIASTVLKLANATSEDPDRPIDGVDLDPFLRDEEEGPPHQALFWRDWRSGGYAIRSGDDKLIKERRINGTPKPILDTGDSPQLFDLGNDISESQDLLAEQPKTAQELAALWNAWNADNAIGNLFYGISSYNDNLKAYLQGYYDQRVLTATQLPVYEIDLPLVQPPVADCNATGLPTISGTPQVDETLTAETSSIADEDGLEGVSYRYQWTRSNGSTYTDIAGETDSAYTLVFADQGKTLKVKVSFTDDADNDETLTSEPTEEVTAAPNRAATGDPAISGTPQVDQTLTASTSAIADQDGLDGVSYEYQWTADDTDVDEATEATYTPSTGDVGKTIKVKVSFTDDRNNDESRTSAATTAVLAAPSSLKVADGVATEGADATLDFVVTLDPAASTEVTVDYATQDGTATAGSDYTATSGTLTFAAGDTSKTVSVPIVEDTVEDDGETFKLLLSNANGGTIGGGEGTGTIRNMEANAAPTGLPTISGTPQVGETLTVETSAIEDGNGLSNVSYSYQWVRDDSGTDIDIEGATDSTYVPSVSDMGKTLKVRVSFTDDAGNAETLTSEPTETVTAAVPTAPQDLTVSQGSQDQQLEASWQAPSSNGGSAVTGYKVQWKEATDSWDTAADVSEATETGTTYIITDLTGGVEYAVRVIATNDVGAGPASTEAKGTPAGGVSEQVVEPENSAPTGLPGIGGTPQVDQTLTADTSSIDDEDGLTNVSYRYQWIAGGTDIDGATGSTYTLTSIDQGKTIQVRVSFTDDADNQESLTSEATEAVEAAAPASLTAGFQDLPDSHDGATAFTFRVLFSEDVGISYANMRDDAFSLSEGDVTGARRVDGRNDLWEITVEPDDDSDVGITLPANRSCTTTGAICTREDSPRQLTNSPTATVTGPAEAPPTNKSAAGAPTISGTPQVEQTLTADTSSITDEDGLTNVSYRYQWIAGGTDIDGATGSSYTLTASEQGQTIQVRVTFTDDRGNAESLTSEATDAVAAKPIPLTATFTNVPTSHGGSGATFTFDLAFSENVKIGYINLRDHAFTEDGGEVDAAQRKVQGSNQTWTITVKPEGNGAVTITLPETTNCDDQGAICTKDDSGRKLSHSLSFTVSGPGQ